MQQVFKSFLELGKSFGVSPKEKKDKPFHCRRCGKVMKHIPGTNVFLCEGRLSDGSECGNKVFTKRIA